MTVKRREFLLACALLPAWPALQLHAAAGRWQALAEMPDPVQEIYPSAFRRHGEALIVNAGGLAVSLGDPVKRACAIYHPAEDRWSEGVPLPQRRHHVALSNAAGAVYASGGFRRSGLKLWVMSTNHWRSEDPGSEHWEEARPLPGPRAEAVTLVHDERIHVIGGRVPAGSGNSDWDDQRDTGLHWIYDPLEDSWRDLAPLPVPRNSSTGAVLNGQLYVISGRTVAAGNNPLCHRYDPASDSWSEVAPLPAPRQQSAPRGQGGLAGAAFGGRIYAFGGEWLAGDGGVYADVWEYEPDGNSWQAMEPMPRPRHGLGAVALDDGVYLIGGALRRGGSGVTAHLDRFIPVAP